MNQRLAPKHKLTDTNLALGPIGPLIRHHALISLLVKSDIRSTYARATLGLFWLILFPLFYVTVFVAIRVFLFDSSSASPDWQGRVLGIHDTTMIGLQIFVGFVVFWTATETLSRSTSVVVRNSSLVQDSAFPPEALPWVTLGVSIFNLAFRFVLCLVVFVILTQQLHWTVVLFPIVTVPLVLMMIGLGFALAAIGPYFRDLEQIISALTTGLLLLSAVIFPIAEVPDSYKPYVVYNPIAMTIEQARLVIVLGRMPDWSYLAWALGVGVATSFAGMYMFRRLKRGFADVF